jgi:hypothetical protein
MQSARAEPGASGMEEGEGVDRTSSRNHFEKRRAAIWVGVPVLYGGTVVETPTHERLVIADEL